MVRYIAHYRCFYIDGLYILFTTPTAMRRRTRTSASPTAPVTPTGPAAHILKLQVGEYDFSYARPSDVSPSADNLAVGTAVILAKEDAALLGVPYCGNTERLAISNTHCVEDIGPRRTAKAKTNLGIKVDVSVVCIVPLFDFCILRCSLVNVPPAQRHDFVGLRCLTQRHEMPVPGTPVTAHGYALDSETVHTTQGIVTSASGSHLPGFLSHSASIASGNSGGPLVESASGKLVGLNTATLIESEAIALAVPCWVIFATIAQHTALHSVVRPATLGFSTKSRSPGDPVGAAIGVRVTQVRDGCRFALQQGDVITHVNENAIGAGGKLLESQHGGGKSTNEVLSMLLDQDQPQSEVSSALVQLAMASPCVHLTVERASHRRSITVTGEPVSRDATHRELAACRLYPFHEPVPHLTVGGITLQNLSVGLLEAFDVDGSTAQERDCLSFMDNAVAHACNQTAVVISFCSLNSCLYDHCVALDRVTAINGAPVRTVTDVAKILSPKLDDGRRQRKRARCDDDGVIRLHLAVDGIVSVRRDQLRAESETVLKSTQQSSVLVL